MKYIDEFRDGEVAQRIAVAIAREVKRDRRYHFMEFCGGHTHAISRYGVADLLPAWKTLVEHTEAHFSREDYWMAATRFAAGNCHSTQHAYVLAVMREGIKYAERGELHAPRTMAAELAVWFPQHTEAMDAALAQHLRNVGYDPATDTLARPEALPQELIHGCGGACSSGDDEAAQPHAETASATA